MSDDFDEDVELLWWCGRALDPIEIAEMETLHQLDGGERDE